MIGGKKLRCEYVKMAVFWNVAPCNLVEVYRSFRGACCLNLQDDTDSKYLGSQMDRHLYGNSSATSYFSNNEMCFCSVPLCFYYKGNNNDIRSFQKLKRNINYTQAQVK
jgi:hypothetical protein